MPSLGGYPGHEFIPGVGALPAVEAEREGDSSLDIVHGGGGDGLFCRMPELSPTRATALQSEIRHFAGWHLALHCPRCRMGRNLQMDALIKHVGAEKLLGDVVRRLRCQDCGTAPDWIELADGVQGTARKVRSVMLVE